MGTRRARNERGRKYWLAHQGDYNGYHTVLIRRAASRDLIIILSNLDTTSISALQKSILEILK